MTRPVTTRCTHCHEPILQFGQLWVHDLPGREHRCIVASRYTGTHAEPEEQA